MSVTFDKKKGTFRVEANGELDRQGVLRLIASASDALVEAGRRRGLTVPKAQPAARRGRAKT